MDNKSIGESIKRARLHSKYTQQDLANKIGVTHAAISYWKNGINVPNVLDCCKIADVLEITVDELIGRKEY